MKYTLLVLGLLIPPAAHAQLQVGGGLAYLGGFEELGVNLHLLSDGPGRTAIGSNLFVHRPQQLTTNGYPARQVTFGLDSNVHVRLRHARVSRMYALAGLRLAYAATDIDVGPRSATDPYVADFESAYAFGLNLGAGITRPSRFGRLYGEAKYVLGQMHGLAPLELGVGVRFGLGRQQNPQL